MSNATKDRNTVYDASTIYSGRINRANMPAADIAYAGTMRCLDANQRAVKPSAANAALRVRGVVKNQVDNSTGAADAKRVELMEGEFEFANSATNPITLAVLATSNPICYAEDDSTVGSLNTAGSLAGIVLEVNTGSILVGIGSKYFT